MLRAGAAVRPPPQYSVRPLQMREGLAWLCQHNVLYEGVGVDQQALDRLAPPQPASPLG